MWACHILLHTIYHPTHFYLWIKFDLLSFKLLNNLHLICSSEIIFYWLNKHTNTFYLNNTKFNNNTNSWKTHRIWELKWRFLCLILAYNNSNNRMLKLPADFIFGKYNHRMLLWFFKAKNYLTNYWKCNYLNVSCKYKVSL